MSDVLPTLAEWAQRDGELHLHDSGEGSGSVWGVGWGDDARRISTEDGIDANAALTAIYRQIFEPDAYGRLPWGRQGITYSQYQGYVANGYYGGFLLPTVQMPGKAAEWRRTGRPMLRTEFGPAYREIAAKIPDAFLSAYSDEWGYVLPAPLLGALSQISTMVNAQDKLGFFGTLVISLVSAGFGAAAAAVMAASGAIAATAAEGVATEAAASAVETTGGGTMFDDFADFADTFDDLGDYSGWQEGDIYDFGSVDTGTVTGDDIIQGDYQYQDGGVADTAAIDSDAQYQWQDSNAYGSTAEVTPEKLSVADIEDADVGKAMRELQTKGSSFDFGKVFKDQAGRLFKLVTQQAPGGQTRVVPKQVRLPNGQLASVNAQGKLVAGSGTSATTLPYQITGAQITAGLQKWAVPIAIGVGGIALWSMSQNRR